MITLNTTTRKLQVVLSGAVTTNQLPVVTSFADKTTSSYTGGANRTTTNNTTQVDIVAAPAASTIREVDFISVYNKDTTSKTVTILYDDNGTDAELIKATLAVDDTLIYSHAQGWKVLDSNGAEKTVTTVPTTSAQLAAQITDETGTGPLVFATGGAINPASIGATTRGSGAFTTLDANDASVISVSSASPALRITQTGAGNALTVEDSSNPDATPFIIDPTGVVVIGHTAAEVITAGAIPALQVLSIGDNASSLFFARYSANTGAGTMRLGKSRSTTVGGRGVVQQNDILGNINFYGDDGTNFVLGAQIFAASDATPGTNDMPGRLVFATTADGASSSTARLTINSAGLSTFTGGVVSTNQTSGVGYATGAGGTVTQATSKATGVTLNRVCGQITTAADSLGANTRTSFTFTNSAIAATDNINVHRVSGGTANAYRIEVDSVASGSCVIAITNITGGALSEAVVISFAIMKCVTS